MNKNSEDKSVLEIELKGEKTHFTTKRYVK